MRYEISRSGSDIHVFIICYEDRFYEDVPKDAMLHGPWRVMDRDDVSKLKPEHQKALAEKGYDLIHAGRGVYNPQNEGP